jgi:ferrous iron transport protein A
VYNTNLMKLVEIPLGARVRLLDVQGRGLRAKLIQYGLHTGDSIRLLRAAPLGGPLLVEASGREIALGRGVAEKILVEAECESH